MMITILFKHSYRSILKILGPFIGLLAADAILYAQYHPTGASQMLGVESLGQWFFHATALLAFLLVASAGCTMVVGPLRDKNILQDSPLKKIILVICVGFMYALLDIAYGQSTYTLHYSQWLARIPSAVTVIIVLVSFMWLQKPRELVAKHISKLGFLTTLWVFLFSLAIGNSFHQFTTKHFREFGHALIVYPIILLWIVTILGSNRLSRRLGLVTFLIGFFIFCGSLTAASYLSNSSAKLVETRLIGTSACRRLNRELARLFVANWNPAVAENIVGLRKTPSYPAPVFKEIKCHVRDLRKVDSVLMLSWDALRIDYFGLSPSELPNIQRLRRQSLDFTRATSINAVTTMSFYGLHTGLYPYTLVDTDNALTSVAQSIGGEHLVLMEDWQAPKGRFTDQIISAIDKRHARGKSYIIHAHYLSLHPAKNWAGSDFSYHDVLKDLDNQLGRIVDALDKRGLLDKTLLIFTADHGEELGHERGYQGHGFDVSQSIIHVPLMVRYPGGEHQERRELVSTIDIFPTILEQLGVTCPLTSHGRTLSGVGSPYRVTFASSAAPSPIYRPGIDLLFADIHAVFVGDWKLIYNRGSNVWALFNLKHDPLEQNNLIDDFPKWAEELTDLLDQYLSGAPPSEFSSSTEPSL